MQPLTITDIQAAIRSRQALPSEILAQFLARIDQFEPNLRSFVTQTRASAEENALQADQALTSGAAPALLSGVPYTLKDIINTGGLRTTAQSRSLAKNVPTADAEVYRRLKEADGILLGKSATWEFAHGGPSWDVFQEPARNPWDLSRDPSGSSSGSAVGIAAGFCAGSIGSDTGGSVRGPAAACGVVGLKTTSGLVSREGVIPNSYSLDTVGPIAWTAEDVAILLQAITAGNDGAIDYRRGLDRPLEGVWIGIPYDWIDHEAPPSQEVRTSFDEAIKVLRSLGARTRRIELPPLQLFEDTKKVIAAAELFAAHGPTLRRSPELLGSSFRLRISAGAFVSGEDYVNAQRWRHILSSAVDRAFKDFDSIALPTAEPAPKLEPRPAEGLFTGSGFLAAWNVSGNPALATRMGYSSGGLPLSLQLVGRPFGEARILNVGHQYEINTPWADRRPTFLTPRPAADVGGT